MFSGILFVSLGFIAISACISLTFIVINNSKIKNLQNLFDENKHIALDTSNKLEMLRQQISILQTSLANTASQIELSITQSVSQNMQSILLGQQNGIDVLHKQLVKLTDTNTTAINELRSTVEERLLIIQKNTEEKLEKIRETVDEKLHDTLEKRLGDSFKIVSERLEMVYQGLGEMKHLAEGVGDLKKVLMNVKTRGIMGEVQLGNILEQFLAREQYSENVVIKSGSQDRIEFTINLPGKDQDQKHLMLPIDAKFPLESYQRLIHAQEICDQEKIMHEIKSIENSIKKSAKTIAEKYIYPPKTTDFAIMFIPIEGLYAEILRNPGLLEHVQREYKIIITGPTTLSAIVNSLQMGFRTLAIEKRSGDVWKVLDIVRREFVKFADLLGKTRIKLEQAGSAISDAENRSRLLKNKLDNFENKHTLPGDQKTATPSTLFPAMAEDEQI